MHAINTLIFWILKQICRAYTQDFPRKIQHFKADSNNFQTGYTGISSKVSNFFTILKKKGGGYKLKIRKIFIFNQIENNICRRTLFFTSGVKLCATLNMSHTHHYKPLFFIGTCENIVLQWAQMCAQNSETSCSIQAAEHLQSCPLPVSASSRSTVLPLHGAGTCAARQQQQQTHWFNSQTSFPNLCGFLYTQTGANIWELSQETDEYPLQHMWNTHTFQR